MNSEHDRFIGYHYREDEDVVVVVWRSGREYFWQSVELQKIVMGPYPTAEAAYKAAMGI